MKPCGEGSGVKQQWSMRRLIALLGLLCLTACGNPAGRAVHRQPRPARPAPARPAARGLGLGPDPGRWRPARALWRRRADRGAARPGVDPAGPWRAGGGELRGGRRPNRSRLHRMGAGGRESGCSGRYGLAEPADFKADLKLLVVMRSVMGFKPAVTIAEGPSVALLISALREGLPSQGAILSAPVLIPPSDLDQAASFISLVQLGGLRAAASARVEAARSAAARPGGRDGPAAWQMAQSDLFARTSACLELAGGVPRRDPGAEGRCRVKTPVMILHSAAGVSGAETAALCRRLPRCVTVAIPEAHASPVLNRTRRVRRLVRRRDRLPRPGLRRRRSRPSPHPVSPGAARRLFPAS